jgi:aspartate carbamoyltransferase catalytic subunit
MGTERDPSRGAGRVHFSTRLAVLMLESLVRALPFHTVHCVIGQGDTMTSHPRQVLADMFPIVVAELHTHLERKRAN